MRVRLALAVFAAVFGIASLLAAVTTVRQVRTHTASLAQPTPTPNARRTNRLEVRPSGISPGARGADAAPSA